MMGTGSCCCGPTDPICLAEVPRTFTTCIGGIPLLPLNQQFYEVVVGTGDFPGTYLVQCDSGSTGGTLTFNRYDDSDGITVQMVVTDEAVTSTVSQTRDLVSLTISDGATTWVADGADCDDITCTLHIVYRLFPYADMETKVFRITVSGIVNDGDTLCVCTLERSVDCPFDGAVNEVVVDDYLLLPGITFGLSSSKSRVEYRGEDDNSCASADPLDNVSIGDIRFGNFATPGVYGKLDTFYGSPGAAGGVTQCSVDTDPSTPFYWSGDGDEWLNIYTTNTGCRVGASTHIITVEEL